MHWPPGIYIAALNFHLLPNTLSLSPRMDQEYSWNSLHFFSFDLSNITNILFHMSLVLCFKKCGTLDVVHLRSLGQASNKIHIYGQCQLVNGLEFLEEFPATWTLFKSIWSWKCVSKCWGIFASLWQSPSLLMRLF